MKQFHSIVSPNPHNAHVFYVLWKMIERMKTGKFIALVIAVALIVGLSTVLVVSNATAWNPYRIFSSQTGQGIMGQNNSNSGGGLMSSTMMGNSSGMNSMMQGMMNGNGMQNMMNQMMVPTSTIDNQTVNSAYSTPSSGVTVDRATNTISIDSNSSVTLPVEAAPVWNPQSGDFWLIYGLINPKITVTQGEAVHFLFINMDNDTHMPAITTMAPPYQYMPMMQQQQQSESSNDGGGGGMMPGLMGASGSGGSQGATSSSSDDWLAVGPMLSGISNPSTTLYSDITLSATFNNTGTYWYLCLYPGHAQMGMYGEISVVTS
ncbi:MAG: plastocyanin/azurin family copper-binding protein [Nitrososphaerales archaeon]